MGVNFVVDAIGAELAGGAGPYVGAGTAPMTMPLYAPAIQPVWNAVVACYNGNIVEGVDWGGRGYIAGGSRRHVFVCLCVRVWVL